MVYSPRRGFVELSHWYGNWGYNWGYYRDIFAYARDEGLEMVRRQRAARGGLGRPAEGFR